MAKIVSKTEVLFLGINRLAILLIMSLSLLLSVALGAYSLHQFLQTPAQPAEPKVSKVKSVDVSVFLSEVSEKNRSSLKNPTKESEKPRVTNNLEQKNIPAFLAEGTKIFTCSLDFARAVGVQLPAMTDEDKRTQIETLRLVLERKASELEYRLPSGEKSKKWVSELEQFICSALKDERLIQTKRDNQSLNVLRNLMDFYADQSIKNALESARATSEEEARFAREWRNELTRVEASKAIAQSALIGVAICLGAFFALSLYLTFVKIENHLRDIKSGFNAERQKNESA